LRRPARDDGAQSLGYATFFAAIIVGILMWIIFQQPINTLSEKRDNATAEINNTARREAATKGADLLDLVIDNYLIWVVGIAFFGLIVWSVFLRKRTP